MLKSVGDFLLCLVKTICPCKQLDSAVHPEQPEEQPRQELLRAVSRDATDRVAPSYETESLLAAFQNLTMRMEELQRTFEEQSRRQVPHIFAEHAWAQHGEQLRQPVRSTVAQHELAQHDAHVEAALRDASLKEQEKRLARQERDAEDMIRAFALSEQIAIQDSIAKREADELRRREADDQRRRSSKQPQMRMQSEHAQPAWIPRAQGVQAWMPRVHREPSPKQMKPTHMQPAQMQPAQMQQAWSGWNPPVQRQRSRERTVPESLFQLTEEQQIRRAILLSEGADPESTATGSDGRW